MTFLTETVNLGVGTALFLHALFKVIVNYVRDKYKLFLRDGKSPDRRKVTSAAVQGRLPENLPSVIDIKRVLPKTCFECRVSTSMYYLAKDTAQVFFSAAIVHIHSQPLLT